MLRLVRRLLSPLHPRKLALRGLYLAHRLGWHHVWLWLSGLAPRRLAASARWLAACRATLRRRRREPRLTVAVDIAPFWEPLTGIGWYLYRLLEHLAARDDVRLRLYGPSLVDKGDQPEPVVPLPTGPALEEVCWSIPESFSIVHYWLADRLRAREGWLVARDRNDVLFAPNYFLPDRFHGSPGALVATVHDLSVDRVPETMRESTRRDLEKRLRATTAAAAALITDSDAVRGEIVEAGLATADAVHAVPLAPGSVVRRGSRGDEHDDVSAAGPPPRPERAPSRYILHVGTLEPRKDVGTLLTAFDRVRARHPEVGLVLTGGWGWKADALRPRVAEAEAAGWLWPAGYVDQPTLEALYDHAEWLAMASLYEGFGLPAVEAMAAGVPLLLSDLPVLREVGGDAALYAPARDVDAWAALVDRALGDADLRTELAHRARTRAERFDWGRTADATLEVWRRAGADRRRRRLGPRGPGRGQGRGTSQGALR